LYTVIFTSLSVESYLVDVSKKHAS